MDPYACILNELDTSIPGTPLQNPRKKEKKDVDKTSRLRFYFAIGLPFRQAGRNVCAWRERLSPSNSDVLSLSI
ncbi:hypothetical protein KAS14_05445 [Candidatus Bathyarchaeota archaeon]|nr:hypothetical protein [Candidatus Bathyarchaeota archaeon]